MRTIDYRGKPPMPRRWLTRAEFIIVLTGVAVRTAMTVGAGYFYVSLMPTW